MERPTSASLETVRGSLPSSSPPPPLPSCDRRVLPAQDEGGVLHDGLQGEQHEPGDWELKSMITKLKNVSHPTLTDIAERRGPPQARVKLGQVLFTGAQH